MLRMVSYLRRPLSGHIMCYLNRTYRVLPTILLFTLDRLLSRVYTPERFWLYWATSL